MKSVAEQFCMIVFDGKRVEKKALSELKETYCLAVAQRLPDLPEDKIKDCIEHVNRMSYSKVRKEKENMFQKMENKGDIREADALVSCDYYMESAGVTVKEYRVNAQQKMLVMEELRAEILENETPSDESLVLLWLLKQSRNLSSVFSDLEVQQVETKYVKYYQDIPLAKKLFDQNVKDNLLSKVLQMVKYKRSRSAGAVGLAFMLPNWNRKEAVFIETEKLLSSTEDTIRVVESKLTEKGHSFCVKKTGKAPMAEINNVLYELIPCAVRARYGLIYGVKLRRVAM